MLPTQLPSGRLRLRRQNNQGAGLLVSMCLRGGQFMLAPLLLHVTAALLVRLMVPLTVLPAFLLSQYIFCLIH